MKLFINALVVLIALQLMENVRFAHLASTVRLQLLLLQIAQMAIIQLVVWYLVRGAQWATDVWIRKAQLFSMLNLDSTIKVMNTQNAHQALVALLPIQKTLTHVLLVVTLR